MYKKFIQTFLIIFITIQFYNCLDKKTSNKNGLLLGYLVRRSSSSSNLPSNLSVNVPRSIRKSDITASILKNQLSLSPTYSLSALETAEGFRAMSDGIGKMSGILEESQYDLHVLSGIIEDAKLQPGVCIPGNSKKVKITETMMTEIKDSFLDYGFSESEAEHMISHFQATGHLPRSGEEVPTPAVTYYKISEGGYKHELHFTTGEKVADVASCPPSDTEHKKTLRYNDNFEKAYYSYKNEITLFGTIIEFKASVQVEQSPTRKDKLVFKMEKVQTESGLKSRVSDKIIIEECNIDTDHADECVTVKGTVAIFNEGGNTNEHEHDHKVEFVGRVDKNGGYIQTEIDEELTSTIFEYKELFNSSGTLLSYEKSINSGPYVLQSGSPLSSMPNPYDDTAFSFEDEYSATFKYPAINVGTGIYTDYDQFVIVHSGINPNTDDHGIIGHGFFEDDNASSTVNAGEVDIEYWGDGPDVATAEIWRQISDSDHNITYTKLADRIQ